MGYGRNVVVKETARTPVRPPVVRGPTALELYASAADIEAAEVQSLIDDLQRLVSDLTTRIEVLETPTP